MIFLSSEVHFLNFAHDNQNVKHKTFNYKKLCFFNLKIKTKPR